MDIFEPYILDHQRKKDYKNCFVKDIMDYDFPSHSFDAVVICDVMEHLLRGAVLGKDLFRLMERCAKKKVIIFTPNGYVPNDEVDGNAHQAHCSAWWPEDYLQRGYKVAGASGLRFLYGKASRPKYHPYSICSAVGMVSQRFVYARPELAWHSYAVKEVA